MVVVKRLDMPRVPPLPDSLEYLQPVRKQLAGLRAEELNEDFDPSMVEAALAGRIAGLPPALARERLCADAADLQGWLSHSGQGDRLHFALGFMLVALESPEKLLAAPREGQPQEEVHMQFPSEAKAKPHFQGWKIRWNGFTAWVLPCDRDSYQREIRAFQEPVEQYANLIAIEVSPLRVGPVQGVKRVETTAELGAKHVKYALEVPGGYATAAVMKKGLKWQESHIEQLFATIQVAKPHESAA
jgi:hypothetical protein